jgi:hypothetical protein
LGRYLSGQAERADGPFNDRLLSSLIKAQLEQGLAMGVFSREQVEALRIPAMTARLATGDYHVDYAIGRNGKQLYGDLFILNTREEADDDGPALLVDEQDGVGVIRMSRALVRDLAFACRDAPTLNVDHHTLPYLGRYVDLDDAAAPAPSAPTPAQPTEPDPAPRAQRHADPEPAPAAPTDHAATPTLPARRIEVPGPPAAAAAVSDAPADVVAPAPTDEPGPDAEPRDWAEEHRRATAEPVKLPPYDIEDAADVVRRLGDALVGHRVDIASHPSVREADLGPRVVRAYVQLRPGEKIANVRRVSEDIARDVGTSSADIHIGNHPARHAIAFDLPVPGLEYTVTFDDLRGHASFATAPHALRLGFCAGIDVTGAPLWADLATMPHMLVAGTTGSGKTVFLRTLLLTLALHRTPAELRLRLSSSKPMDFKAFTQIPHAGGLPMAEDRHAALALSAELVAEMDRRIELLSDAFVDNLDEYNAEFAERALPRIVAVLDEFSETVLSFESKDDRATFANNVARLAQKARAAGIHLILCMQRPDATVVQGPIKSNVLHRFGLKLPQVHDSRVILDEPGAETLLGKGDLLYKDADTQMHRVQVPFLSNKSLRETLTAIIERGGATAVCQAQRPIETAQSPPSTPAAQVAASTAAEPVRSEGEVAERRESRSLEVDQDLLRTANSQVDWMIARGEVETRRLAQGGDLGFTRARDAEHASVMSLNPPSFVTRTLEQLEVGTIGQLADFDLNDGAGGAPIGSEELQALRDLRRQANVVLGRSTEEDGRPRARNLIARLDAVGIGPDRAWSPLLFTLPNSARLKIEHAGIVSIGQLVDAIESGRLKSAKGVGRRTVKAARAALEALTDPTHSAHHPPEDFKDLVRLGLELLSGDARDIVRRRLWAGETLEKIGNDRQVTRERVRQLEKGAYEAVGLHYSSVAQRMVEDLQDRLGELGGMGWCGDLGLAGGIDDIPRVLFAQRVAGGGDIVDLGGGFVGVISADEARGRLRSFRNALRDDLRYIIPFAEAAELLQATAGIRVSAEGTRALVAYRFPERERSEGVAARPPDSSAVVKILRDVGDALEVAEIVTRYARDVLAETQPELSQEEREKASNYTVRNLLSRSRDVVRLERGRYVHVDSLGLPRGAIAQCIETAVLLLEDSRAYVAVEQLYEELGRFDATCSLPSAIALRDLLVKDPRVHENTAGALAHMDSVTVDGRTFREVVRDILIQAERPLSREEIERRLNDAMGERESWSIGHATMDPAVIRVDETLYTHVSKFGLDGAQRQSLVDAAVQVLPESGEPMAADAVVRRALVLRGDLPEVAVERCAWLVYALARHDERLDRGPGLLLARHTDEATHGLMVPAMVAVLEAFGPLSASEIRAELAERYGFRGVTATVERHAAKGAEAGELRQLGDGRFSLNSQVTAAPRKLPAFIGDLSGMRRAVENFQVEASGNPARAWSVLRTTEFWIFDPVFDTFCPARAAAYADLDFAAYGRARASGTHRGESFDDETARARIERITRSTFQHGDSEIVERLTEWADELVEPGVLDGLGVRWRFMRLPASGGAR